MIVEHPKYHFAGIERDENVADGNHSAGDTLSDV